MSRKSRHKKQEKADLLKGLSNLSLEDIVGLQKTLPTLLQSKLQQMSRSDNLENLLKANLYLDNVNQRQDNVKAVFFNPDEASDTGRGYKDPMFYGSLPFEVLRRMGDIFVVRAVVNTRVEQVQNFLHFSTDEQKEGYTIRRKRNPFEKASTERSKEDQIKIGYIRKFLEEGGFHDKWESFDTFQDFGRKVVFDSLTLDQLAFEIVRDRSWNLARFRAVDASLIRFLDSIDPKFRDEFEKYRFKGYLPKYCMAWQGQIMENPVTHESVIFYPWELGIGIRNKSTNIYKNGYGTSELETLSSVMTWILWGFEYNGNYFSKSSQPKGIINVKNPNISQSSLDEFRQAWQQTMVGTHNSHRTPIINGLDLQWLDLSKNTNRDMEFSDWLKFLLVMACAVYRIDPSELGFQFKDQTNIFGQAGQKERLQHSKDKGLKPILVFLQEVINYYLVSELDEDFEFVFTGVDAEDEGRQVEIDAKKIQNGMVCLEDIFEKYSGRKFNPETDTILNQSYQLQKQMQLQQAMYGGEAMNEEVDRQIASEEKEDTQKSFSSNPIMDAAMSYIEKNWGES
nr:MAG TPA: Portal protein [Caudoviricetes sp.]DAR28698.1 MAG TPA: Portal protein [Herelleviridae sp.]